MAAMWHWPRPLKEKKMEEKSKTIAKDYGEENGSNGLAILEYDMCSSSRQGRVETFYKGLLICMKHQADMFSKQTDIKKHVFFFLSIMGLITLSKMYIKANINVAKF